MINRHIPPSSFLGILCALAFGVVGVSSYTQAEAASDSGSAAASMERVVERSNTFELSQPPTRGLTASYYQERDKNNYIIDGYYWDGTIANLNIPIVPGYPIPTDDPCSKMGAPVHGIEVVRDNSPVIPLSTYNQWKSIYSRQMTVGVGYRLWIEHSCGREFSVTVPNPEPGNYSIRFYSGTPLALVDTKPLFTVGTPPPPAAPCDNTTPLYGAIHWDATDFYLTSDPNYMSHLPGWEDFGAIGRMPVSASEYSKPFRRYYHGGLTVNYFGINEMEFQIARDLGAAYVGDIGYLFDRQLQGTIPLYRSAFVNPFVDIMFLYTTDYSLTNHLASLGLGYDIVGYICPSR